MGVGGQRQTSAALPPGKNRYPLYRLLGWSQDQSGRLRNISPPPGFDPPTVQPVASCYTDCAISTHRSVDTDYIELTKFKIKLDTSQLPTIRLYSYPLQVFRKCGLSASVRWSEEHKEIAY
jgi:hypothetical protein